MLAITACGSDDDGASAEERFCEAGDALEADITGLASVDLVSGGLDALNDQFDAVRDDVADLRDAGVDVAEDELDALDASVANLSDTIDALGDDISADNATAVATAVGEVQSSATAVFDALATICS